ncbi:MAG TPA: SsrA-binding protein [Bdellovibrionales bacterium]|nr:SsrA-binding protein [Pseudobdellovibrionaceae bacterium]HAG91904.1 SsrA-binding protein [Bdellovibrionales bacterium]|tara:strand:- start:634 stop:1089 length:456 start_codon:yes stop_codon:yes gene_type:complete
MGIKIIADNKKARFDYEIVDTFEAGLVLTGSEVKSLRNAQVQLKDSYVSFRGHEAFLQNAHISEYRASSYNNHEPERLRKLLLHEHELEQIRQALAEKGLSCVPLKIYFKRGRVKLEIGLGRGKKKGDKRESVKAKSSKREMDRAMKKSRH